MAKKSMHRRQGSCNVVNHQGQSTTERGCFQPGTEPLPDILCVESLRRKKEEERNGGKVAEKRETKEGKKNFGQNNIVSLYVSRV